MSSNNKKHYDEQAAGSRFAAGMTEKDIEKQKFLKNHALFGADNTALVCSAR